MAETEDFPHLTEFLATAQQNDQIDISDGVQKEIMKLLTVYDKQRDNKNNGEIYKILGELEDFQKENKDLKQDLQRKKTMVLETTKQNEQLQESIKKNKIQLQLINEENEFKIIELNEKITLLEKDNQYLNEKLSEKEKQIQQSQQEINDEFSNIDQIKNENLQLKQKLQEKQTFFDQQVASAEQALKDKRIECENLRLNLKQTTKKWQKLKSAVAFLKQSHKGDEQIIKSLKNQIEQTKEQLQAYKDGSEQKFKKDDQMIVNLVQMIQKKEFDIKKLDELINRFDKKKTIQDALNPKENKLSSEAYNKIQEYEIDGLDDSNINFDQENVDIIKAHDETQQTIRVSHDNYDLSQYELNDSLDFANLRPEPSQVKFEVVEQPVLDTSIGQQKTNGVDDLKKKLQLDLDRQINFKRFQTQRNSKTNLSISEPMKFGSYAPGVKKEREQDDTLKHNFKQPSLNLLDTLNIPLSEFKQGVEMLEKFCNDPDRNPTTFVIQKFDKKQLIDKFEKAKNQNLKKYLTLIVKLFLYQINYLEGKISTLTYNNSYLDLQLQNKKDELNYLLKVFLDKNAKNQEFLNSANNKLIKLRKRNKRRLQQHQKQNQINQDLVKMKVLNEDSELKDVPVQKNIKQKNKQDSELSIFKKNDLNRTNQLLSEEHSIDMKDVKNGQKEEKGNEDNFFSKVTNLFNQFQQIIQILKN